jgi:hypothetical protein
MHYCLDDVQHHDIRTDVADDVDWQSVPQLNDSECILPKEKF